MLPLSPALKSDMSHCSEVPIIKTDLTETDTETETEIDTECSLPLQLNPEGYNIVEVQNGSEIDERCCP